MAQGLMTSHQRTIIRSSISSLRGEIDERRGRIRIEEEELDTLRAQRSKINWIFNKTSFRNFTTSVEWWFPQIRFDDFGGNNRCRFTGKLEEMQEAINKQRAVHANNIEIIDKRITELENSIRDMQSSNSSANSTIINLLSEWQNGNAGMQFPNSPIT